MSPVLVQMWGEGREPSPSADVAGDEPSPGAECRRQSSAEVALCGRVNSLGLARADGYQRTKVGSNPLG